jgi:hypothetical protein
LVVGLVAVLLAVSCGDSADQGTASSTTSAAAATTSAAVLAPPDSQLPAAGVCGDLAGAIAVFTINADTPSPRCGRAIGSQRVQVTNRTDTTIDVQIAGFTAQLKAGATEIIGPSVNQYLAPGVHVIHTSAYGGGGPELWVAA